MGAESTSPLHTGETPADLLRNEVNSQQHPSIYEDRRPKSIEDTKKTDGKGIALGQKGPWSQHGDQGDWACCRTPGREPG